MLLPLLANMPKWALQISIQTLPSFSSTFPSDLKDLYFSPIFMLKELIKHEIPPQNTHAQPKIYKRRERVTFLS